MNILVLTNKLPYPPRDGGSIATLNMLTGLRDTGNRVTCLSINTTKHPFPVEQIPVELKASIRFVAVDADTSIKPLSLLSNLLFSKQPYIASRFFLAAYTTQLVALIREASFDLVQLEGPYMGCYIKQIRAITRAKIALRAHNLEHLIWSRKAINEKNPVRRWYLRNLASRLRKFELEVVQQSDLLVPISAEDERSFARLGIRKPGITLPAGLSLERYPETNLPAEPSLFFIGALDWIPNQEGLAWFLRNVFSELTSLVPSIRFHIAGRNAPESFTQQLNHPLITYHGEVEDAIRFIQSYRVMVAPLLTGSGIRIKILEGMALGRPVATTPVGIEGIEATKGVEVAVEADPEELSTRLAGLLTRDDEALPMARAGRQFVEKNFDTFEISTRLSQYYKSQV